MAQRSGVVARSILCPGETYKSMVKLTFARGAALDDPSRLFDASSEGPEPGGPSISVGAIRSMRTPAGRSCARRRP